MDQPGPLKDAHPRVDQGIHTSWATMLGLGLAACRKGLSVGFTTAAALVHELMWRRWTRPRSGETGRAG